MVNLFIGLIVDAIFTIKGEDAKEENDMDKLHAEIRELKEMVARLAPKDS